MDQYSCTLFWLVCQVSFSIVTEITNLTWLVPFEKYGLSCPTIITNTYVLDGTSLQLRITNLDCSISCLALTLVLSVLFTFTLHCIMAAVTHCTLLLHHSEFA